METLHNTAVPFATRFPALVEKLYSDPKSATNGSGIENAIAMQFAAMGAAGSAFKRDTFKELLLLAFSKKCYGILRNPGSIEILGNIAAFGNKTVNPANTWVKDSLTTEGQLASLIRHLFAKYEVPAFMEYVFAESSKIHMLWYIQLGRGDSVHELCAFPVAFTQKMAHEFRNTPGALLVEQAIRRAQALGYGANASVAEAVTWSASLEEITHNKFRAQVIQFIAKNAPAVANVAIIQMVVEYVAEMHRADISFSLKGRTWASVTRLAQEFHAEKAKRLAAEVRYGWMPSAIGSFELKEGSTIATITELTSSEALYEEGSEMSHCVADYDTDCEAGRTAIFSLRAFNGNDEVYAVRATLEVSLETTLSALVQAKAICNQEVSEEAEAYILEWAKVKGITVACELYSNYYAEAYVPAPAPPVQAPRHEPLPPYEPYRPAAGTNVDINPATVARIILLAIKIIVMAKGCS